MRLLLSWFFKYGARRYMNSYLPLCDNCKDRIKF